MFNQRVEAFTPPFEPKLHARLGVGTNSFDLYSGSMRRSVPNDLSRSSTLSSDSYRSYTDLSFLGMTMQRTSAEQFGQHLTSISSFALLLGDP